MKKKFALLMCAVMLFGAMLTCIPASAAAKTEGGPLAITEVCYAPGDAKYEFIEVINTSDAEVDLKNYYVYRFGFSNASCYHATGIVQMFGFQSSQACGKLVRVSLAEVEGTTTLAKNNIAVIWFASASSKDEKVEDFKEYWSGLGNNMTNVNVIKLPVYDAAGADLYPVTHISKGDANINDCAGTGFLPDQQAGFTINLIHKDFAATDGSSGANPDVYPSADRVAAKTRARQEASDCSAFVMLAAKYPSSGAEPEPAEASRYTKTSAHYYGYVNETKFNAAKAELSTVKEAHTRWDNTYLPAGLMVFESNDPAKENLAVYTTTKGDKELVFPVVETRYIPNPGTLYDGQMGLAGDIRVNDAASGVGSLTLNTIEKPVVDNLAVINDEEEDDKKTEQTTAAPEATTAAPAEEKGCGSSIAISGIAVLATVGACAAVVSKKRKDD